MGKVADVVAPLIDEGKLQYKLLELENGLQALLVSDEKTQKCAAALDVRVGSMADPKDLPGLAHFTEHMLFYASEAYPEEDGFNKFVGEHGGYCNAFTSAEDTNYYFEVNSDHLEPTLDRFSHFFRDPLVTVDAVEREVKAVDSEHGKNLESDVWRRMQLWRYTANQGHPVSGFYTGDIHTLLEEPRAKGIDPHQRMLEFYHQHYSANLMRLCVYGCEPLDQLEKLAQEKFSSVPSSGFEAPSYPGQVLEAEQRCSLIHCIPVKDGHSVEFQWDVPSEQDHYQAAPCSYISHHLGHEGEGSVFAVLKAQGWATSLVAGEGALSFSNRSFFMCKADLTDMGQEHVQEVGQLVFAYIRLLQAVGGVTEDRHKEIQALSKLHFNYRDKPRPGGYTSSLAGSLQTYAPEDVLLASYNVSTQYDAAAINAVLNVMTPAAVRVMWSSKTFQEECTSEEPVYKTRFSRQHLPAEWTQSWESGNAKPELSLPAPNPYIATDFELIDVEDSTPSEPIEVHQSANVSLWHRPNASFRVPKAVVYLSFLLPESYSSPEQAVLTRLFAKLLTDYLNEDSYAADVAGLYWGINTHTDGFLLWGNGYHHKLLDYMERVLSEVLTFKVRPDRFQIQKDAAKKEYENLKYQQPYQRAVYSWTHLLELHRWHTDEYQAVIGGLTPEDLEVHMKRLFGRCLVQGYITGNLVGSKASQFGETLQSMLETTVHSKPLLVSQRPDRRVIQIQQGCPALLREHGQNPTNDNSAVLASFQVGPDDIRRNAMMQLLVHIGRPQSFNTLRTQEQLGYLVFLQTYTTLSVRSIAFIIQSTAFSAAHIESRVQAFIHQFSDHLGSMSSEEFTNQVEELAKAKLETPKTLRQLAGWEWSEIDEGCLCFDRRQQEAAAVRQTSLPVLQTFLKEVLLAVEERRQLSVHVLGRKERSTAAEPPVPEQNGNEATQPPMVSEHSSNEPAGSKQAQQVVSEPSSKPDSSQSAEDTGLPTSSALIPDATQHASSATSEEPSSNGAVQQLSRSGSKGQQQEMALITDVWAFKRAQACFASSGAVRK
ncbi:hypothetical protein WJX74_008107 [Apatococcus lobatus]|uniref:Uncharacterized protein n=1 Tax=Apatococcus lobatus TaxID=904363 RepID=A0AAW1RLX7_9CHLO